MIENYFHNIFTSGDLEMDEAIDCIPCSLSTASDDVLLRSMKEKEANDALFIIHSDKSPGPDGLTPTFYQRCWSAVGREVVHTVHAFFQEGMLPMGLNETHWVPIRKKKKLMSMGDIRLIALCNVLYKVMSKDIANGLTCFFIKLSHTIITLLFQVI